MWFKGKAAREQTTDPELILRFRQTGDARHLGVLFERYAHLVFGVCMKYLKDEEDSKDAMMQVFENLGRDLKRFDIRSFPPWLHSVAKNHCLMHLRKKRMLLNEEAGYRQSEATLLTMPPEMRFMNEDINEEHLRNLDRAMASLGAAQRRCIQLFYLDQKSYQEVAQSTGYDLKQVKSHIQNGKRNLKNYLLKETTHAGS